MHTWTVEGTDKGTGRPIVRSIEAATEEEAAEIAAKQEIVVSSVSIPFVSVAPPPQRRPGQADGGQTPSQNTRLLHEIAGHTRSIRGWVTFMGIVTVLYLIEQIVMAIFLIARK